MLHATSSSSYLEAERCFGADFCQSLRISRLLYKLISQSFLNKNRNFHSIRIKRIMKITQRPAWGGKLILAGAEVEFHPVVVPDISFRQTC